MQTLLSVALGLLFFACGSVNSGRCENELGKQTYQTYCMACHGVDGKLKLNGAPDLTFSKMTLEEKVENVTNGGSMMPAFAEVISEEEIKAVAVYLNELKLSE